MITASVSGLMLTEVRDLHAIGDYLRASGIPLSPLGLTVTSGRLTIENRPADGYIEYRWWSDEEVAEQERRKSCNHIKSV